MIYHAPISAGDLVDRISILRIKQKRIEDEAKLALVRRELELLEACIGTALDNELVTTLFNELLRVNEQLWGLEDRHRALIEEGETGMAYYRCASRIPVLNDLRATLKRAINKLTGSEIVEVKSHVNA